MANPLAVKFLSTDSSFCRGSCFSLHDDGGSQALGMHPLHLQKAFFPIGCARSREEETEAVGRRRVAKDQCCQLATSLGQSLDKLPELPQACSLQA